MCLVLTLEIHISIEIGFVASRGRARPETAELSWTDAVVAGQAYDSLGWDRRLTRVIRFK
jgi:hypothetical protein